MNVIKNNNFIILILIILFFKSLTAQLSISNLLEYQLGNLPDTEPGNLSTLYDQLNISYNYGFFTISTKFEQFQTVDRAKSYADLRQRSLTFSSNDLEITIGNFYKIIGRGLLLRSYEIPGSVIEDRGFRTRYGFFRDLDGVLIKYEPDFFEVSAFRGKPLNNEIPPTVSVEFLRPNLIEGMESNIYFGELTFGGSYLRNNLEDAVTEYGSLAFSANLPFDVQVYSEFTQQFGRGNKILDLSDNTAHALYLSMSMFYGAAGLSMEYKDYHNFMLGFNDPPPLVKEHTYLLLNRSTHTLEPANETGWQTEFFYTFDAGHALTINLAQATNELFSNRFFIKSNSSS